MELLIDVGNTRLKYAKVLKGKIKFKGCCSESELIKIIKDASGETNNIMISSVQPIKERILFQAKKHSKNTLILSSKIKTPFKYKHKSLKNSGPDRLALVAGGLQKYPNTPVLIIDVGTCITFDFINSNKVYFGGAISPGVEMRLKSLNNYTAFLPLTKGGEPKNFIGTNTKEAILSGVIHGTRKEIDGTIDAYKLRYPNIKTVLTGGDKSLFDKKLKNSIFADEDIIFKGMYFILDSICK